MFIYGESGLGKTHLMHAIANYISQNYPEKRVLYTTSENFLNDFIDSITQKNGAGFRMHYRNVDVLMIDDVQFLKNKTQVFFAPEGDHYITRLTHTLDVSQIARSISRSLGLNEDLTEAIALGHDLGHTPFGHAGERALNEVFSEGFKHYEQSCRVVDKIEKKGRGLNLTYEVRNGILCHTRGEEASTLEGRIVKLADRIAYINHDIDDAVRAGILTNDDIPDAISDVLGHNHSQRINTLVMDAIFTSREAGKICQTPVVEQALLDLRSFMFEKVYRNPIAKGEESKAKAMLSKLFEFYVTHPEALPEDFHPQMSFDGLERTVCDYIAGMTDRYAIELHAELYIPKVWRGTHS